MPAIQAFDKITGALTTGPIYVCRAIVIAPHKLVAARVYVQNVVFTGTLEVRLRYADLRGPRGGADAAEVLENDDFIARTSINTVYRFSLLDFIKAQVATERTYFLSLTGTNSADRFDEPLLVLDYDRI